MHEQKYNINWNNYSDHLRAMLHDMLESKDLTDVILVCDDKRHVRAHKFVLSACSPVFRNIVKFLPYHNSVIYLTGIKFEHLQTILEFIYYGAASLNQESKEEFIKITKNLEIKGMEDIIMVDDINSSKRLETEEFEFDVNITNASTEIPKEEHQTKEQEIVENGIYDKDNTKLDCNDIMNESDEEMYFAKIFKNTNTESNVGESNEMEMRQFEENNLTNSPNKNLESEKKYSESITKLEPEQQKFDCDQCDYQTLSLSNLKKHTMARHELVRYECSKCDYSVGTKKYLKYHIRSKHEGIMLTCSQCEYKASNPSNLREHVKSKHEGFKHVCKQCGQEYLTYSGLRMHRISVHDAIKIKYPCNQCDYQSLTMTRLNLHIETKHKGTKFPCNECHREFTSTSGLKLHIQAGHKGRNDKNELLCDHCPYSTSHSAALKMHTQSIHEGIKQICVHCKQKYSDKSSLRRHIQEVHEGVKYNCNKCSYQAGQQGNLRSHIKLMHEENQEQDCIHCNQKCADKSSLRRHIQEVHEGRKYDCNKCNYQATQQGNLKSHMKLMHKENQVQDWMDLD